MYLYALALQAPGLAIHVLHHDVEDLAQGGAVLQHLPGLVGVVVDLDLLLVPHRQQAFSPEMRQEVVVYLVLVQILPFDEQLGVVAKFRHMLLLYRCSTRSLISWVRPWFQNWVPI